MVVVVMVDMVDVEVGHDVSALSVHSSVCITLAASHTKGPHVQ